MCGSAVEGRKNGLEERGGRGARSGLEDEAIVGWICQDGISVADTVPTTRWSTLKLQEPFVRSFLMVAGFGPSLFTPHCFPTSLGSTPKVE